MVQARLESLEVGQYDEAVASAFDTFRVLLTEVTETLSQNQDQFRATMYNLRMASESLKEFSRSLESKPSRLIFDEEQPEKEHAMTSRAVNILSLSHCWSFECVQQYAHGAALSGRGRSSDRDRPARDQ